MKQTYEQYLNEKNSKEYHTLLNLQYQTRDGRVGIDTTIAKRLLRETGEISLMNTEQHKSATHRNIHLAMDVNDIR